MSRVFSKSAGISQIPYPTFKRLILLKYFLKAICSLFSHLPIIWHSKIILTERKSDVIMTSLFLKDSYMICKKAFILEINVWFSLHSSIMESLDCIVGSEDRRNESLIFYTLSTCGRPCLSTCELIPSGPFTIHPRCVRTAYGPLSWLLMTLSGSIALGMFVSINRLTSALMEFNLTSFR